MTLMPSSSLSAYILLDRTGSMNHIWEEALSSVNAYAAKLAEDDGGSAIESTVTLAVFDAQEGLQFDVLRGEVKATDWTNVTSAEASPRGMTPLFDAIGRIVSLAETAAPERAVVVIMTDGRENASRELTKETAKAALDRVRGKGWEVVFLGAEFGKFNDAHGTGIVSSKSMAMRKGRFNGSLQSLAMKSKSYGRRLEESVDFNDEDRREAGEEDVTGRG